MKRLALLGSAGVALAAFMLVPVGKGVAESAPKAPVPRMDLSTFPSTPPEAPTRVLFIHHSCGGQLLAPAGAEKGADCIYDAHPNGGALRDLLRAQNYDVHEASYASDIGELTDLFDWLPKFRNKMDKVLKVSHQDELYPDDRTNQIVVFKSCYPNNRFVGEGAAPGNPSGPELTVWNAKATLSALLPEFEKRPDVLFVYMTAPPVAPKAPGVRMFRWLLAKARGRSPGTDAATLAQRGAWAREFNDWVVSRDGWLKDYPAKNVLVFDYYGILTGEGRSNLSEFATENGYDSHPSSAGNERAAKEFVPFLNRALHRARAE